MDVFIMHENEFSWWEDNKEMTKINWGALYCTFGMSGMNYKVARNFRVWPDEKAKSNLKLLKDKML